MKIELTEKLARAAAQDCGDRNMRDNGRTSWDEDDYNAACRKLEELKKIIAKKQRETS